MAANIRIVTQTHPLQHPSAEFLILSIKTNMYIANVIANIFFIHLFHFLRQSQGFALGIIESLKQIKWCRIAASFVRVASN